MVQNTTPSARDKQIKTNDLPRCSQYLAEDQLPTDFGLDTRHCLTRLDMSGQRYITATLHWVPNMILQSAVGLGGCVLTFSLEKPWICFLNGSGADREEKKIIWLWEPGFERMILERACLGEGEEQNNFSKIKAHQTKGNIKPKLQNRKNNSWYLFVDISPFQQYNRLPCPCVY